VVTVDHGCQREIASPIIEKKATMCVAQGVVRIQSERYHKTQARRARVPIHRQPQARCGAPEQRDSSALGHRKQLRWCSRGLGETGQKRAGHRAKLLAAQPIALNLLKQNYFQARIKAKDSKPMESPYLLKLLGFDMRRPVGRQSRRI